MERDIALRFCWILNEWLAPDTIAEINRRNAADEHKSACHSHDFCDANQAMLNAMESLGIDFDPSDEEQTAITNRAWAMAKMAGFCPERLTCVS